MAVDPRTERAVFEWRLLAALMLTIAACFALPIVLERLELLERIKGTVWFLVIAIFTLLFAKYFVTKYNSGDGFLPDKIGNDICMTALSGLLAAKAVQLGAEFNAFPGAGDLLNALGVVWEAESNSVRRSIAVLDGLFWLAVFCYTITAAISLWNRHLRRKNNHGAAGALALISTFLGMLMLSVYVLMLVSR